MDLQGKSTVWFLHNGGQLMKFLSQFSTIFGDKLRPPNIKIVESLNTSNDNDFDDVQVKP